ncbi:MAG: hypothetical protein AAGA87_09455 [Pseudomonadota bacterium]
MTTVLLLGSGPDVVKCRDWDLTGIDEIVAINNAWRVRSDWTVSIFPEDFPEDRHPPRDGRRVVQASDYIPSQNRFGGVVYIGGTMAFTASYWALDALKPSCIYYYGCDMVYAKAGPTHFYGAGTADPLRADPTLQNLEAKACRLQALAAREGCALINLSDGPSRLTFPRGALGDAGVPHYGGAHAVAQALRMEEVAGCRVSSGRYWEEPDRIDPAKLRAIDAAWLAAYETEVACA